MKHGASVFVGSEEGKQLVFVGSEEGKQQRSRPTSTRPTAPY